MATQAQILANQASAQHFTGPKSAGGKASSSGNNLRHSLTLGVVVLDEAGRVEFCGFEPTTLVEMKANCLMRCEVFQQFIDAAACLNKVRTLLGAIRSRCAEDPLIPPKPKPELRFSPVTSPPPKWPSAGLSGSCANSKRRVCFGWKTVRKS